MACILAQTQKLRRLTQPPYKPISGFHANAGSLAPEARENLAWGAAPGTAKRRFEALNGREIAVSNLSQHKDRSYRISLFLSIVTKALMADVWLRFLR